MEKKREKHFFKTVKTPDGYTVKKWFSDRINNGNPSVLQKMWFPDDSISRPNKTPFFLSICPIHIFHTGKKSP